jgi:hypothetical protein
MGDFHDFHSFNGGECELVMAWVDGISQNTLSDHFRYGLRLRSEERTKLPLSTGFPAHVCPWMFEGGSRLSTVGWSAHACHKTFESGSSTPSGLRSRSPKALEPFQAWGFGKLIYVSGDECCSSKGDVHFLLPLRF